jgi:hypothetical protein
MDRVQDRTGAFPIIGVYLLLGSNVVLGIIVHLPGLLQVAPAIIKCWVVIPWGNATLRLAFWEQDKPVILPGVVKEVLVTAALGQMLDADKVDALQPNKGKQGLAAQLAVKAKANA